MTAELIYKKLRAPSRHRFVLSTSVKKLDEITGRKLPGPGEVFKFISLYGGVASLSFIKWVANREPIHHLQASTLRIGPKQYQYLNAMAKSGRLKSARFVTSSLQKEVEARRGRNYSKEFMDIARRNSWEVTVANNHSKIILMQTASAFWVLESSSNLNENPKIEHYSFQQCEELHAFYTEFFDRLFELREV